MFEKHARVKQSRQNPTRPKGTAAELWIWPDQAGAERIRADRKGIIEVRRGTLEVRAERVSMYGEVRARGTPRYGDGRFLIVLRDLSRGMPRYTEVRRGRGGEVSRYGEVRRGTFWYGRISGPQEPEQELMVPPG